MTFAAPAVRLRHPLGSRHPIQQHGHDGRAGQVPAIAGGMEDRADTVSPMCIGVGEKGGPKRCSADARGRAEIAHTAVLAQTQLVDDLTAAHTQSSIDIDELVAAINGDLSPEQEAAILARTEDPTPPEPEPESKPEPDSSPAATSWHGQMAAASAEVDQAWSAVQIAEAEFAKSPEIPGTAVEKVRHTMECHEQLLAASTVYEAKVRAAGELVAARADTLIAERLDGFPEDPPRVTLEELKDLQRSIWTDGASLAEYHRKVEQYNSEHRRITGRDRVRAEAYRDVLSQIRPVGDAAPKIAGKRPHKQTVADLQAAARFIPGDWITAVDDAHGPITVRRATGKRGYYSRSEELIVTGGEEATMHHEYAHRMEAHIPQISAATNAFLVRRTQNADGVRDQLVRYNGSRSELLRPDGFVDKYVGKEYGHESTEVFTTGTEALFAGQYGGLIGAQRRETGETYSADEEHRALILGLYATALRGEHR